jgi:site-specific DNA-methyltransferase (adenine-specific)
MTTTDFALDQHVPDRVQDHAPYQTPARCRTVELNQYFTPSWVCEAIVERHYRALDLADTVLEPSCGDGRFLQALPAEVHAIGVEIDPVMAERARQATGRTIITGDFCTVEIPGPVTHVVGNPPFDAATIHAFLGRAHGLLEHGGTCGLLLPAYVLQTSSKVMALNRHWSIEQELMPRNIFPRLKLPLVFAMFRKDRMRKLVGFFLYREAADVAAMPKEMREALRQPASGSVWRQAVRAAFARVGSMRASLADLYAAVERPTQNAYWREKVRQTLQVYPEFRRANDGSWTCQPQA